MFQIPIQIYHALLLWGGVISTTTSRAMLATARPSCFYNDKCVAWSLCHSRASCCCCVLCFSDFSSL